MTPSEHAQALAHLLARVLPRILSQACRDEAAPGYGCFDRNFWHYRMRDFASIILQQGGYTVLRAVEACPETCISTEFARHIARGAALFWNRRAVLHGAFEEYYPWEQGYPPAAFSTLAVAKLAAEGVVEGSTIRPGLAKAAQQLLRRFEPQAANQQVAGLAALAWIRRVAPDLVPDAAFDAQRDRTLALQNDEGWYWEYDGPDIGYLSVTLDCLWDLYDATGDHVYADSASRALSFIHRVVGHLGLGTGMLNARNTDYLVPYGIARFLREPDADAARAAELFELLYANLDSPSHFFHAVDDRYWCHYIGHSVARAIVELKNAQDRHILDTPAPSVGTAPRAVHLDLSGYLLLSLPASRVLLALKKGGCFTLVPRNGKKESASTPVHCSPFTVHSNFGWIVRSCRNRQFVSHWWSKDWRIETTDTTATVRGELVPHKELESTPWKHIALRLLSFVFGASLIATLKRVMIFKKAKSPYDFTRVFDWTDGTLHVTDTIGGLRSGDEVSPAPRASKRHVASADSYHAEDATLPILGWEVSREGATFHATRNIASPPSVC